jgi:Helix-turn-helix domain
MPWKESSVMEERLRFVARLLEGEPMTDMCLEFGISRKTGYKIFNRYREHGCVALSDRSRRPVRYANQLPRQVESLIVTLKRDKPHWGCGPQKLVMRQRGKCGVTRQAQVPRRSVGTLAEGGALPRRMELPGPTSGAVASDCNR